MYLSSMIYGVKLNNVVQAVIWDKQLFWFVSLYHQQHRVLTRKQPDAILQEIANKIGIVETFRVRIASATLGNVWQLEFLSIDLTPGFLNAKNTRTVIASIYVVDIKKRAAKISLLF